MVWVIGWIIIIILVPIIWIFGIKAYVKHKNKRELK